MFCGVAGDGWDGIKKGEKILLFAGISFNHGNYSRLRSFFDCLFALLLLQINLAAIVLRLIVVVYCGVHMQTGCYAAS